MDNSKSKSLVNLYTFNQSTHWLIIGMLTPILTQLQLEKGLNLFEVGLTLGTYSAFVILFELPTGGLSDSIGRKRVYLTSLIFLAFSILGLIYAQGLQQYLGAFALFGISRALSSGSIDAWFVDEFQLVDKEENLQKAFAFAGLFFTVGLGIGAAIGGLVPQFMSEYLNSFGLYAPTLIIAFALIITQFILTLIMIKDDSEIRNSGTIMDGFKKFPGVIKESIEYGIKHKIVFMLVISSGLWCFAISGVEMLWQPYTKEITGFSFQPWMLGVLGAGYFFSGALGHFLSSKTCKLFNNSYALILMAFRICMGAVLFVMANSSNVQGFALFYWLLFLLNGIITSPHATIFNQNVESKNRSTLISFESFVLQIGGLLGSLIFGHISKNYSISTSWMIGGTALILSSLCYFRVLGHEKDLQVEAVNN